MKNNNSENNVTDTDCTVIDEERRNNIGYLAQHRLFDQIPVLLKDISTPDYCALLTPDDEDDNENHCANHNKNHNHTDNLNHNENDSENHHLIENHNEKGNKNKKESNIDVRELGQRNEIDKNKGKNKDKDNANLSSSLLFPSLSSSPFSHSSSSSNCSHSLIRVHFTEESPESTETVFNTSAKSIDSINVTSLPPSPPATTCDEIILNMWMGPANTTSPLHHDPYHNILSQVIGCKYVRLYDPNMSDYLYPRKGRMSNNR